MKPTHAPDRAHRHPDDLGIAQVPGRHPLVRQVGWQTRESDERRGSWAALGDPATRFYLSMNPEYPEGQGLLTLLPVTVGGVARGAGALFPGAAPGSRALLQHA